MVSIIGVLISVFQTAHLFRLINYMHGKKPKNEKASRSEAAAHFNLHPCSRDYRSGALPRNRAQARCTSRKPTSNPNRSVEEEIRDCCAIFLSYVPYKRIQPEVDLA